jgi:hypothetical protein
MANQPAEASYGAPGQGTLDGPTVARHLQERFADVLDGCQGNTFLGPAFLCTGVLMRGTEHSTTYYPWNPNPGAGGVSFLWLRQDANFRANGFWLVNGFIVLPVYYADDFGYDKLEVMCAFPVDGDTWARVPDKCGPTPEFPVSSKPCHLAGVTTAEQWRARYAEYESQRAMCGFAVGIGDTETRERFNQIPRIMQLDGQASFVHWNELVVKEWPQNRHATLPVEAFFYLGGSAGLANAQYDQGNFVRLSGRWVPVIRVTFASASNLPATFTYLATDQAVQPTAMTSGEPAGRAVHRH